MCRIIDQSSFIMQNSVLSNQNEWYIGLLCVLPSLWATIWTKLNYTEEEEVVFIIVYSLLYFGPAIFDLLHTFISQFICTGYMCVPMYRVYVCPTSGQLAGFEPRLSQFTRRPVPKHLSRRSNHWATGDTVYICRSCVAWKWMKCHEINREMNA